MHKFIQIYDIFVEQHQHLSAISPWIQPVGMKMSKGPSLIIQIKFYLTQIPFHG